MISILTSSSSQDLADIILEAEFAHKLVDAPAAAPRSPLARIETVPMRVIRAFTAIHRHRRRDEGALHVLPVGDEPVADVARRVRNHLLGREVREIIAPD